MSDDEKRKERAELLLQIDDAEQTETRLKARISTAEMVYGNMALGLRGNVGSFALRDDGCLQWNGKVYDVPDAKQVAADVQELKCVGDLLIKLRHRKHQLPGVPSTLAYGTAPRHEQGR